MTPTQARALTLQAIAALESLPPETVVISVDVCVGPMEPTTAIHVRDLPPGMGPVTVRTVVDSQNRPQTFRSVFVGEVKVFAMEDGQ